MTNPYPIFDKQKRDFLAKKDKSKKGDIDIILKKLINNINSSLNYYSTSSCSGRILLIMRKKGKKFESLWFFASHSIVRFKPIKKAIVDYIKNAVGNNLYFRFEPAIFHISCKTIHNAQSLVDNARNFGFRRSGIQSTNKKIVVEISSSEISEAIIVRDNKILVSDHYLEELICDANIKHKENKIKIKKLEKLFSHQ